MLHFPHISPMSLDIVALKWPKQKVREKSRTPGPSKETNYGQIWGSYMLKFGQDIQKLLVQPLSRTAGTQTWMMCKWVFPNNPGIPGQFWQPRDASTLSDPSQDPGIMTMPIRNIGFVWLMIGNAFNLQNIEVKGCNNHMSISEFQPTYQRKQIVNFV